MFYRVSHSECVYVWRHWQKLVSYLVGNFVIHLPQQLFRFGGAICTSHWRSFSIASGSPEWRTNGFCGTIKNKHIFHFAKKKNKNKNIWMPKWWTTIANVALLSVSSRSDAASMLACSSSRRFFFKFSRCMSAARSTCASAPKHNKYHKHNAKMKINWRFVSDFHKINV